MSETAQGRLGRRLRRILLLLPYAIRHPGVSVAELSERFGVDEKELIEDLDLVFLCGLPGYGPGDLIDVTLEEDRVYVSMADYFSTPLRLTPAEGLALYAGAEAIADLPGMEEADALKRALQKLGRALGSDPSSREIGITVKSEPSAGHHLETLRRALLDSLRVRIEYFSAGRGELTDRTVAPWGLVSALGRWYLIGHDEMSGEERMFRTDRIKSVTPTGEPAEVPADFDPGRYSAAFADSSDQETLRLEISPDIARWFEDYYPVRTSEELADGWRRVELALGGTRWAATLLLRLGEGARKVEPVSVREAAASLAGSIAARYLEA